MKCPHCGGNLSLEDKYCPFCGQQNALAFQHAQDMAHYRADYEQTKREVLAGQKHLSAIIVRVLVLVVLIIGIIITLKLLDGGVYSMQRDLLEKEAEKNAAEYTKIMDRYLADEDYLGFSAFCESRKVRYADAYEKYSPTIYAANVYSTCISYLLSAEVPGPYGSRTRYLGYFTDSLNDFYKDHAEHYYGDEEEEAIALYEKAYAGMKQQMERCLVTYVGLSEEDAKSMETLTKAKRAMLIEEANGDDESEE